MNNRWIIASLTACGVTFAGMASLAAQQRPERGQNGGGRPTAEMLKVCEAKQSGDSCSVTASDGTSTDGTCMAPPGRALACIPEGGPEGEPRERAAGGGPPNGGAGGAGGPPRGESNSGGKLPDTQAYTTGVLCDYSVNKPTDKVGLSSVAQWSCTRGQRVVTANGVPDHPTGQFPNPANPNSISEQTVRFAATTSPVANSGPGGRVKEPVMGLNGVKFDPGTGGACPDEIGKPGDCPLGPGGGGVWNIEALGQSVFDFGEDENNAHVQPNGAYHYHGVPDGMLSPAAKAGKEMALIGWAADGFPVYARYGFPRPNIMLGELKLMETSYRLKANPDTNRPSIDIVPMGAFQQDWEYVEGLGDLDECNGRFASTPEFPEGIYHYYATDAYPYVQRCVKGSIDSEPEAERPPERGEGRGRGGRGERGSGGGRGGRGERGGQ